MNTPFNKITPQQAVKIVKKNGIEIDENDFKKILGNNVFFS
ncbi:hypothetical protein [Mucilaginibacter flavidus]|nr:hypothetical protein [Mucilaginibacter flavidus]